MVELAAACRFDEGDLSPLLRDQTLHPAVLRRALNRQLLWVADAQGDVVGFLAAQAEGAHLHILEMSVLPRHGRQGLGKGLLEAAVHEAVRRRLAGVTLTTFAHIPWNGPAYAKAGFSVLDEAGLTPVLRQRLNSEREQGLGHRVAMRRSLA